MNPTKARSGRPATCANCAGNDLQRQITTYPVRLTAPGNLTGKEIHVRGVTLYECQSCGHRMPTPAGQVKVDRCVTQAIGSCDRPGCYQQFIRKSPQQKFCSKECRRAMERVFERERRWRQTRP